MGRETALGDPAEWRVIIHSGADTMTPKHECNTWGTAYLQCDFSDLTWVPQILEAIPVALRPNLIARVGKKRRAEALHPGDLELILSIVRSQRCCYLFGDQCEFSLNAADKPQSEARGYCDNPDIAVELFIPWYRELDRFGLTYYATAVLEEEYVHQNGYRTRFSDGDDRVIQGWVGRDYRRYVPGLYWLNYWSYAFVEKHKLNPEEIYQQTGGELEKLANGWILKIGSNPNDWRLRRDKVESFLAGNRNFFSKSKVEIPTEIRRKDFNEFMRSIREAADS